ncbi:MAG TPA: hypothetical protein VG125_03300, partial [Pirellulales bacterium]|nr:hypothetical protein [Pirellulales bacterium]
MSARQVELELARIRAAGEPLTHLRERIKQAATWQVSGGLVLARRTPFSATTINPTSQFAAVNALAERLFLML